MGSPAVPTNLTNAQKAAQQNALARQYLAAKALDVRQKIFTQTFANPASQSISISPRNVGLLKGFWVEVAATYQNNDNAAAITPTDWGAANMFQLVQFTDYTNYIRVQTEGKHLGMLNTARHRRPYFDTVISPGNAAGTAATTGFSNPQTMGPNWSIFQTPASIAHGATGIVKWVMYVPLAYSSEDLRGSVYAGVVNATAQLVLQFNQFPGVVSGDSTNAVFTGSASVVCTSATVTVTQHYLDQIPVVNGQPFLPGMDINTVYEIKSSYLTGMANGIDFPIPFTNFRDFMSEFLIYNDGTSTNGGRPPLTGTQADNMNYIGLQTANLYYPIQTSPRLQAGLYRDIVGADLMPGCYYFSFRKRPISTTQYGNQQLVINPNNLGSTQTPYVKFYSEAFGVLSALLQSQSLAAN